MFRTLLACRLTFSSIILSNCIRVSCDCDREDEGGSWLGRWSRWGLGQNGQRKFSLIILIGGFTHWAGDLSSDVNRRLMQQYALTEPTAITNTEKKGFCLLKSSVGEESIFLCFIYYQ